MSIKKHLKENYEMSDIESIAEGNLINGISGFIYYSETCDFYEKHKSEIWEMLEEDAEEFGYKSVVSFIATFNNQPQSHTQYQNLLCWYAVEREARSLINEFWEESAA